jgi:hypothetical protein
MYEFLKYSKKEEQADLVPCTLAGSGALWILIQTSFNNRFNGQHKQRRLESPNQYFKKWGEKQPPMLGFSSFKARAWISQEAFFRVRF